MIIRSNVYFFIFNGFGSRVIRYVSSSVDILIMYLVKEVLNCYGLCVLIIVVKVCRRLMDICIFCSLNFLCYENLCRNKKMKNVYLFF